MRTARMIQRDLQRAVLRALLALFLIPALTWGFTAYVSRQLDARFLDDVEAQIAQSGKPADERAALLTVLQANPPSSTCSPWSQAPAEMRADLCARSSPQWQFYWAGQAARWTMIAGLLLLATIAALTVAAFRNRAAQLRSLELGWRVLSIASAAEVVLQSAMCVFLSFWLPAWFTEHYFIKLVLLAGIGAAVAVIAAVAKIFAGGAADMYVEGELVEQSDAHGLWQRVRALAAHIKTAPPDQIVAGIDANFFVTEAPVCVSGKTVSGRTLYVSIPLLRVLDKKEADAVVVHELAHLKGGDTRTSALVGPKLLQFDRYCEAMAGGGLTVIAYYLLSLYRFIFELARQRDSREREFKADRAAARAIGGMPLIRALVKLSAYSSYRRRVETELFRQEQRHGETLGIAAAVAEGLRPFAYSGVFESDMELAGLPHPFDSHPLLDERMHNVQARIEPTQFAAVVTSEPEGSWAHLIDTATAVEARLWAHYEAEFAQMHEQDLAFRYRPGDDEEQAIVEKYFPPVYFQLNNGPLKVTFDGLDLPEQGALTWDDVADLEYENGYLGDVLKITLLEKGTFGNKSFKAKLAGVGKQRDQLKGTLGYYWHRHKVAHGLA